MPKKEPTDEGAGPVNKSQAVRGLLTADPTADSKSVIAELAGQGIKVSPTMVYYVRSKMKQAKQKAKPEAKPKQAMSTRPPASQSVVSSAGGDVRTPSAAKAANQIEALRMQLSKKGGVTAYKIKVGVAAPRADAERTRRICEALDGNGSLLICADANQGWSRDQAVKYARAVEDTMRPRCPTTKPPSCASLVVPCRGIGPGSVPTQRGR